MIVIRQQEAEYRKLSLYRSPAPWVSKVKPKTSRVSVRFNPTSDAVVLDAQSAGTLASLLSDFGVGPPGPIPTTEEIEAEQLVRSGCQL